MSEDLLKQHVKDLQAQVALLHADLMQEHAAFCDAVNALSALRSKLRALADAERPQAPDDPKA